MRFVRERPLAALWVAAAVVLVGRLVDLQWHLTHDDFEGAADQVQAHLIVWIGVLLILFVTATAIQRDAQGLGYRLAFGGALLYVPVALWHFIEHANGNDPSLAHFLIAIGYIAMLIGLITATVSGRRQHRTAG